MPKKRTVEQRVSELIATFGLAEVSRIVAIAVELQRPRTQRPPRPKRPAKREPAVESAA